MKYISTVGKSPAIHASEAIEQGLAPDGGLYVPQKWPSIKIDLNGTKIPFYEFSAKLLKNFFEDDPLGSQLDEICRQAFDFPIPLRKLDDTTSVLELFHGPTSAFKDVGARFLAMAIERSQNGGPKDRLALVATSGDTGGAVAAAFKECTKIPVAVLYPKGRISKRQETQLTVWGKQVKAFAVEGTFDDCQRMVKEAFQSPWWQSRFQLISANSINLGRLLPQMAYFAYSSLCYRDVHRATPGFIIPSGNVGNATAALWAMHLGFPIHTVILSHNANETVPHFFKTGEWKPRPSVATLANAMDVGNPSNFERIRSLFPDLAKLRSVASALSISDDVIRETILSESKFGRIWCPHTAAAIFARQQQADGHWIVISTAHPAKFETVIEPLIGQVIEVPPSLELLLTKPSVSITVQPQLTSLQAAISKS